MNNLCERNSRNNWLRDFDGMMKSDVVLNGDNYEISVNMPGFKKEDVHISLDGNVLIIKGIIEKKADEEKKNYIRHERFVGNVSRSFYLGDGYSEEDITAKMENGVLKISFPKETKKQEKKYITIA